MHELRRDLEEALRLENQTERKLAVVSVIDELVREIGFRAVVIGGVAVAELERIAERLADGEEIETHELHEIAKTLQKRG